MTIRKYRLGDAQATARLLYETVHAVCGKDYTPRQLAAWAPPERDLKSWNDSFTGHCALVAEEDGQLVGFGDIDRTGYLDRLYVHKDYQGRGVASALCNELEAAFEVEKLVTHASLTALPFFEKRGYAAVRAQKVMRGGVELINYVMEKVLK